MENVKGMFSRKYGGVPAWLILMVAIGGVYLYMRHTGSSLFGGTSATDASNADPGSTGTMDGQSPEIVFVPPSTTGGSGTNPQHPNHPAGPPATHTITTKQRIAAIMADYRKHGFVYFKNHPGALAFLKLHAPGDYRAVTTQKKGPHGPSVPPQHPTSGPVRKPARKKVAK